ncbi:MAG TPA: thioredoxin domain-containing protein [Syntrophobacteraceae bacterium]|nr:thioredoxin domain-containing protein [Syntrophobacteraceae bacterium]
MPNRLAAEKSPYLLQHAENPVDWHPWGDEAFLTASREDKPIFLSIGYSTCHWCHVMEHESFEDEEVAGLLNRSFVSIKVDREERPDIDQVYMAACQATTGRGGWPLSIFMGPDRKPFYAGTYFPKRARMGMPGLMEIAGKIAQLWTSEREYLGRMSEEITSVIEAKEPEASDRPPGPELLGITWRELARSFDPVWGGFGRPPKFPNPHNLIFLTRWHKRHPESNAFEMVEKTLLSMRCGGIFDQIGFGFHRYSVDERWLVPHFEKMLYDQALLALAYTEAFLATGDGQYAKVVREIFEYVMREMQSTEGGFYCAQDADSEGREGIFFTWTPEQVIRILGKDAGQIFCRAYGITDQGNFEDGLSIPHIPRSLDSLADALGMSFTELEGLLEGGRRRLLEAREKRVHPLKDDKILSAWNGLMTAALARGAQALGENSYARAAVGAMNFILEKMQTDTGRLYRRYRQGELAGPGYADDYAFLIWGLLELYETVFDVSYLSEAVRLQEDMSRLFEGPHGGFYYAGADNEKMIARERVIFDGALPSSNSVAAMNLLRLGRMTGNPEFEKRADALMRSFATQVGANPSAHTQFMQAVDFALGPAREILIAGDFSSPSTRQMIATVHRVYSPNRVLMLKESGKRGEDLSKIAPFTEAIISGETGPTAYLCENFSCRNPLGSASELDAALGS